MNTVIEADALSVLPTLTARSFDLVFAALWLTPTKTALECIVQHTLRIARKAVVLLTVHQNEASDLHVMFRKATGGHGVSFIPGIKIQPTKKGSAVQWGVCVLLPGTFTNRNNIELPGFKPYGVFKSETGAMTGNDVTAIMPSQHRDNPEGTRSIFSWDWFAVTAPRKSETKDQPSQSPAISHRFIMTLTNPGDAVLDFSCGSGTTLISAKKLYREFMGMDIDPLKVKLTQDKLSETHPKSLKEEEKNAVEEIMQPYKRLKNWAPGHAMIRTARRASLMTESEKDCQPDLFN